MSTETLTIDGLERWAQSGAHWRVVEICAERVTVDLCACTGEPMQRRSSEDPAVIAYLRTARCELDLNGQT